METLAFLLGLVFFIIGVCIGCFLMWVSGHTSRGKVTEGASAVMGTFGVIAAILVITGIYLMDGSDDPEPRLGGAVHRSHDSR
jgi:uncharacterized membrane protein (DUF485 family)